MFCGAPAMSRSETELVFSSLRNVACHTGAPVCLGSRPTGERFMHLAAAARANRARPGVTYGFSSAPLRHALAAVLVDRPFRVRFWDGRELAATTDGPAPTFTARSARAVAHALLAPGQLGLARAYVSGELEVDDLDLTVALLRDWTPPPMDTAAKRRLAVSALRVTGPMRPPRPPAAELRPRGRRHSRERDARAVRHHYDLSNELFALFLDESMTYSCAIFEDPMTCGEPLERAQDTSARLSARSSRCGPASVCSTSAAAGAASPCTLRRATVCESSASRSRSHRRDWPASAPSWRACAIASRSA